MMKRLLLLAVFLLMPTLAWADYLGSWDTNELFTFTINTNSSAGAIDADSVPTYRVYEDETGTAVATGSYALIDSTNTNGFYSEQITLSSGIYDQGKAYHIISCAVISSVTSCVNDNFQILADTSAIATVSGTVNANVIQFNGGTVPTTFATGIPFVAIQATAGAIPDKAFSVIATVTEGAGNTYDFGTTGVDFDDQWDYQYALVVLDATTGGAKGSSCVIDSVAATDVVTTVEDIDAFVTSGTDNGILVPAPACRNLRPTTPGNTLLVNATGGSAPDWGQVQNPTTTVGLTGTTVGTVNALAANSITSTVIAADAITSAKIANDAIGATEIANGAIDAATFASGAIDNTAFNVTETLTANPASGGIVAGSFGAGAIDAAAIATDAIGAAEIAANAIGESELAANSITASEIADDSIDVGAIAAGAITSSEATSVASVSGNIGGNIMGSVAALGATAKADVSLAAWGANLATYSGTSGSTAEALAAAGASGDPWIATLPGSYTVGQAGYIMGTNLNATVSSRSTLAASDNIGINWGDITNPSTTQNLSATTISTVTAGVTTTSGDKNTLTDLIWDELLSGHAISGSTGAGLTAAGSAGDPWGTPLPGAYGAGTAGKIIGDNINATITSRLAATGIPTNFAAQNIDASGRVLLQPTQTGVTIPTVTTLTTHTDTSGTTTLLTRIPDTISLANINTQADTAISDARLDDLMSTDSDIDGAAPPTVGSVFHELMTKTAGSFTYDQTTDSNEAIRDRGDSSWAGGGGGGGDICFISGTAGTASTTTTIVDTSNLTSSDPLAYIGDVVEVGAVSAVVSAFNPTTDAITLSMALTSEADTKNYCLIRASEWEQLKKIRSLRP